MPISADHAGVLSLRSFLLGSLLSAVSLGAVTSCTSARGESRSRGSERGGTAAASLSTETLVFFSAPSCPSGWLPFEQARGRVIVGLPTSGTVGGTVGTALGDRGLRTIAEVPSHSHGIDAPPTTTGATDQGHTIECESGHDDNGGSGGRVQGVDSTNGTSTIPTDVRDHDHRISFGTEETTTSGVDEVDVTMPYLQLLGCSPEREGSLQTPSGAVAFVRSSECPGDWTEFGSAQGRIIVGLGSAIVGGQQGQALENRGEVSITDLAEHSHVVDPAPTSTQGDIHLHTIDTAESHDSDGGSGNAVQETSTADSEATTDGTGTHAHSLNMAPVASQSSGFSAVDVTMPYIQLLVCEKN